MSAATGSGWLVDCPHTSNDLQKEDLISHRFHVLVCPRLSWSFQRDTKEYKCFAILTLFLEDMDKWENWDKRDGRWVRQNLWKSGKEKTQFAPASLPKSKTWYENVLSYSAPVRHVSLKGRRSNGQTWLARSCATRWLNPGSSFRSKSTLQTNQRDQSATLLQGR